VIKLALTGSIGMGKSATAALFAARGVPVYDADAAVHKAYARGGEAVAQIEWAFPGVMTKEGAIDRNLLRGKVVNNPEAMKKLEGIIHPIIGFAQRDFLAQAERGGADVVVLDIPLLFETGGDKRVDAIAVVSAPAEVQRARVLARGMTEADFEAILARQTPDSVKRANADFVINTALGFEYAGAQVDAVLAALRAGAYAAALRRGKRPEADASGKGEAKASSGADDPTTGGREETCGKSSSTPKPQGSTPRPETASSSSVASS
jgi:dephospho-CoA kinase